MDWTRLKSEWAGLNNSGLLHSFAMYVFVSCAVIFRSLILLFAWVASVDKRTGFSYIVII